jgi:Uma2 family endonuclease
MSYPKTREVYKITVPTFHALEPFLDPDPRHELLDGQIYVLPIPRNWHTIALMELDGQLLRQERPGLHVWRGGLILNEVSEPWPDLTLLSAEPLPGPDNPAAPEARLVVEVAYPTADFETGPRARAYQAAAIPEYWVVDVEGRRVLRHLLPDYRAEAFTEGALGPQAYPEVLIDLGTLFEGLEDE